MYPRTRPLQTCPSPVVMVGQHHTPEPLRAFSQVRARPPGPLGRLENVPQLTVATGKLLEVGRRTGRCSIRLVMRYRHTFRYCDWKTPSDGVDDLLQEWAQKGWTLHSMSSSIATGTFMHYVTPTPIGVLHNFVFQKDVDRPA